MEREKGKKRVIKNIFFIFSYIVSFNKVLVVVIVVKEEIGGPILMGSRRVVYVWTIIFIR